jgi:hypothetical protein
MVRLVSLWCTFLGGGLYLFSPVTQRCFYGNLAYKYPFIHRVKEGAPDDIPMSRDFPIQRAGEKHRCQKSVTLKELVPAWVTYLFLQVALYPKG